MKITYLRTALVACLFALGTELLPAQATEQTPPPHLLTIVIYKAGPSYKQAVPPEKQLAPHFRYAKREFEAGKLVAYGPETDVFRGFYILDTADPTLVKNFVETDPGVKAHLLQVDEELTWATVIHKLLARYGLGCFLPTPHETRIKLGKWKEAHRTGDRLTLWIHDRASEGWRCARGGP